jgi:hypothetical protein
MISAFVSPAIRLFTTTGMTTTMTMAMRSYHQQAAKAED